MRVRVNCVGFGQVLDLIRRVSYFFDLFCLHRVHLSETDPGSYCKTTVLGSCFVGFPASRMKGLEGIGRC